MSTSGSQQVVQRLWNYCNLLRDQGLSYGDYIEQLTYLLFLKMAHEQKQRSPKRRSAVPVGYDWPSLLERDGDALEVHYRHTLETLGQCGGMLGLVFQNAQNKIQDPAKLRRLIVDLIDSERWSSLGPDVKGAAYEGLLEKNAQDTRGGAGQYFTPRPLIDAIVRVIQPSTGETICDPACGTGGFLVSAHEYISTNQDLTPHQRRHLRLKALRGVELVDNVSRLCAMNLLLHGIGPSADDGDPPITTGDSLLAPPVKRFNVVLTNPPFGRTSNILFVNGDGATERAGLTIVRDDFWASTANKQINFVQHVYALLDREGRAAVVVPDNVLYEGGAAERVRQLLLQHCDVHTLLRLPTGIFYAQGVKANVLFFDRRTPRERPWTERLWVFDLRTNVHLTLKNKPLQHSDLDEFISCFRPGRRHGRKPTWSEKEPQGRWRSFSYNDLVKREKTNLDLFWIKDRTLDEALADGEPSTIAAEIIEDLRAAVEELEMIYSDLATPTAGDTG